MKHLILLIALTTLGCDGERETWPVGERRSKLEDDAAETALRNAAAADLEVQPPELQARYKEAEKLARELMLQHANERLSELTKARGELARAVGTSDQRIADLDEAIRVARNYAKEAEQGRQSVPPTSTFARQGNAPSRDVPVASGP